MAINSGCIGNGVFSIINLTSRIENGDACKVVAISKRIFADRSHIVRDGDVYKTFANSESSIADGSYTIRDGDAYKAAAICKRSIADGSHTVRDGITCFFLAGRILNQRCFVFVEQNPVFITAVVCIILIHCDACKIVALYKCQLADRSHAVRDGDVCKAVARSERRIADGSHTVRDGDAYKAFTKYKRTVADASHAVRDGDTYKAFASSDRSKSDGSHTVRDGDACKAVEFCKRIFTNRSHTVFYHYSYDFIFVYMPRRLGIFIIIHLSCAGNGEDAVSVKHPCE